MFRKKFRINELALAGILVYSAFVSVLYFRMKNAEKLLLDYSIARLCLSSSNCREIVKADVLDYGSSKLSFTNYGPKGIPLESGSFEEYLFTISMENSETKTIKVLPNTPSNTIGFDIENIYIPTKSDKTIVSSTLFDEKAVYVEVWRDVVTLILLTSNLNSAENQSDPAVSIGPSMASDYETVLATENHPVIIAESAKNDFTGWTSGVILMILVMYIFGSTIIGFFYGIDWVFRKFRKDENRIEFGFQSDIVGFMASNRKPLSLHLLGMNNQVEQLLARNYAESVQTTVLDQTRVRQKD